MQVQPINNNKYSNSFGFKIKFETPDLENKLVNISDTAWAESVKKRVKAYRPEDEVLIKLVNRGHQNAVLVAKNLRTNAEGDATTQRLTPDEYTDLIESETPTYGSKTYYQLLERLLNPENKTFMRFFWGNVPLPLKPVQIEE